MTPRQISNIPASVRGRLVNRARAQGESFDQTLLYFAIERFLFRLSRTEWGDRLVVKGATMLRARGTPLGRPTRDIDFFGSIDTSRASIEAVIRECLRVECLQDGIVFEDQIEISEIIVANRYPGVRIVLRGHLDNARFKLKIEIGFDDAVVPDPGWVEYPVLLDLDAPRVLAYQPVTSIAEKFEAMVKLGATNSRMKDFYDIWLLARTLRFDGPDMASALRATFEHRETPLPERLPVALTSAYYDDDAVLARWRGFTAKYGIDVADELSEVCDRIAEFVMPAAVAVAKNRDFSLVWVAGAGWMEAGEAETPGSR